MIPMSICFLVVCGWKVIHRTPQDSWVRTWHSPHCMNTPVTVSRGRAKAPDARLRTPASQDHVCHGVYLRRELAMTIPARFENGVFRPLQDVPIKEGTVVELHVPLDAPAMRPRPIGDSPFAGMWKDREDMADIVEYVNRLRRELHG